MDNKEVMLVGFDIHNFVKGLCNQFLATYPDMTNGEKKAYKLGIDNTLGLLNQTLNEMVIDENECYNNIAVHIKGLDYMEEFLTIEEIVTKLNQIKGE